MARKPRRAPPEKPANARQSVKNIFSLLTGYKLKIGLTVICGIISTVFSVISPLLIGFATTTIFDGINSGNMNLDYILYLLTVIVILYIISAVFSYLQSFLLLDITTDISYNLRKDLIEKVNLTVFCGEENVGNEIKGGYVSDLLSDVMGFAQEGNAWVTLQTHKNVIAIASLKELACVVLVKGNKPDDDMLEQAKDEGIPVLGTTEQTFEVAGKIYQLLNA